MTDPAAPRREASPARLWLAAVLVLAVAAGLAARWVHLQVTRHEGLARKALENQIQIRPLEPPRGAIYDRTGALLAGNNTLFSLEVSSDSADRVLGKINSLTTPFRFPPTRWASCARRQNPGSTRGLSL